MPGKERGGNKETEKRVEIRTVNPKK